MTDRFVSSDFVDTPRLLTMSQERFWDCTHWRERDDIKAQAGDERLTVPRLILDDLEKLNTEVRALSARLARVEALKPRIIETLRYSPGERMNCDRDCFLAILAALGGELT